MNDHPTVLTRALFWCAFMAVLAALSFFMTIEMFWDSLSSVVMLVMGTACWVVVLTAISGSAWARGLWSGRVFRKVFWIVFAVRVGVTVAFPVGVFLDIIPGLISAAVSAVISESLTRNDLLRQMGFAFCLPIVQGLLLQMMFWFVVFVSYGLIPARKRRPREGYCIRCGYDLRASRDRCPECGTAFRNPRVSAPLSVEG